MGHLRVDIFQRSPSPIPSQSIPNLFQSWEQPCFVGRPPDTDTGAPTLRVAGSAEGRPQSRTTLKAFPGRRGGLERLWGVPCLFMGVMISRVYIVAMPLLLVVRPGAPSSLLLLESTVWHNHYGFVMFRSSWKVTLRWSHQNHVAVGAFGLQTTVCGGHCSTVSHGKTRCHLFQLLDFNKPRPG